MKTYATFSFLRSVRQVLHAVRSRKDSNENMELLFQMVREHEKRIESKLGKALKNLRILEIGVGQGKERSRYFGMNNTVIGMDLDIIPSGYHPAQYLEMIRKNGFGRFLKTVGRKIIVAGPNKRAWERAVGGKGMKDPEMIYMDICKSIPEQHSFDAAVSWSVFEHLQDPRAALENMVKVLRPGGVLFISIHLYTACNGHHDIRAFTGDEDKLPPWGHLRVSSRDAIQPSSYLNEWRLKQWRNLFMECTPGYEEYLENFNGKYASIMTEGLRQELGEFTDEELFTVDAIYCWQKPAS